MKKFYLKYTQVPSNPPIEFAEKMARKAKGADMVFSIGGGSTIDVGKYVSKKIKAYHTAIPTTAGSGSEATKFAVFTKNGKKFTMEDEDFIPNRCILNPSLVVSLPRLHTIASGLDALSHAIESWWSPNATQESREYSRQAVLLITASLPGSVRNPENEYMRLDMLRAANYAGRAINITKTSICHALSYPLTDKLGITHGIAAASTLPIFMRYFGISEKTVKKIERLLDFLEIKKPKFTDEIIDIALTYERAKNTPKPITKKVLEKIL